MADGKKKLRWHPFGTPEWWKRQAQAEGRLWTDIGRAAVDIFNPMTPLPWDTPRTASRYPMTTFAPAGERARQRLAQAPTIREKYGYARKPQEAPIDPYGLAGVAGWAEGKDQRDDIRSALITIAAAKGLNMQDLDAMARNADYESIDEVPTHLLGQMFTSIYNDIQQTAGYDMSDRQTRQNLADFVAQGYISEEAAYGKGTPWEKWQHEQADEINQGQPVFIDPELVDRLSAFTDRAEQQGVNVSTARRMLDDALRNPEKLGATGGVREQTIGNELIALATSTMRAMASQEEMESHFLAQETAFQPWYERYAQQRGEVVDPGRTGYEGFSQWDDPAFKQVKLDYETEQYKRNPQLYPMWLKAPMQERQEAGSFPAWVQSRPDTRALQELKQERQTRPTFRQAPKWAVGV